MQSLCMLIDEFYFHNRRGLKAWERIGHPFDTLTVLLILAWIETQSFNPLNLKIALGLGAFSTLFVTKDEVVHKEECDKAELWLHSVLFVLHPLVILSWIGAWALREGALDSLTGLVALKPDLNFIFTWMWIPVLFMFLHQIVYWNFLRPRYD